MENKGEHSGFFDVYHCESENEFPFDMVIYFSSVTFQWITNHVFQSTVSKISSNYLIEMVDIFFVFVFLW